MKFSESWLREWVNPPLDRQALADKLTMAGLELEELAPLAPAFNQVVIGQVQSMHKHADANRLNICTVDVGQAQPLQIVCGAENVSPGVKVPVALIGAVLPNDFVIKQSAIRGIESFGMLCSAKELGLEQESAGLLLLPQDAPLGQNIREYLHLDDYSIDLSITPNRGDCLSILGVAREVSALTDTAIQKPTIPTIAASIADTLKVSIEAYACPHYLGRVIKGINAQAVTPIWLKQRLQVSGIRSIHPVVDVTNYVMLELGQPMHAFDLAKIDTQIFVRLSKQGEKIALLDGSEKELDDKTLVIADATQALAIAGIMGGVSSSVTADTQDIFLESAYFQPAAIAKQRQHYHLNSDSAYRFERGIDTAIQNQALERATQLILEIAGGQAGAVVEVKAADFPKPDVHIFLMAKQVSDLLGIEIAKEKIEHIFQALNFKFTYHAEKQGWNVIVPSYRNDLNLMQDLIEEIARIYGYDHIPTHDIVANLNPKQDYGDDTANLLRQAWYAQGYHEIISYSFVSEQLQQLLDPALKAKALLNPMTSEMTVMRTNLWPGLINTLLYNKSRQQHRIRLFEIGRCFIETEQGLTQPIKLGGIACGLMSPEQWAKKNKEVDFFDVKGDLHSVLTRFYPEKDIVYKPSSHPALHSGQSADVFYKQEKIGVIGALHPLVVQSLDLPKCFVFEAILPQKAETIKFKEFSKFPEIRRDLAIIVNEAVRAQEIQDTIKTVAGDWLKDTFIFDVYQGKGIAPGSKSIALALVLQDPMRTLVDDEVAELVERITTALNRDLGAELRS